MRTPYEVVVLALQEGYWDDAGYMCHALSRMCIKGVISPEEATTTKREIRRAIDKLCGSLRVQTLTFALELAHRESDREAQCQFWITEFGK